MTINESSEQLYIPLEVVRFILDHRRRRLTAEAEARRQATAAERQAAGAEAEPRPPEGQHDD